MEKEEIRKQLHDLKSKIIRTIDVDDSFRKQLADDVHEIEILVESLESHPQGSKEPEFTMKDVKYIMQQAFEAGDIKHEFEPYWEDVKKDNIFKKLSNSPKEVKEEEVFDALKVKPEFERPIQVSYDKGKTFEEGVIYLEQRKCMLAGDAGGHGYFHEGFATDGIDTDYGLIVDDPTHWRYITKPAYTNSKEEVQHNLSEEEMIKILMDSWDSGYSSYSDFDGKIGFETKYNDFKEEIKEFYPKLFLSLLSNHNSGEEKE